jgi:hypothetical protein
MLGGAHVFSVATPVIMHFQQFPGYWNVHTRAELQTSGCFLDAEGLVPPKFLQLDVLRSTCHRITDISFVQWVRSCACMCSCLHAGEGTEGVGSHSALHACTTSLYTSGSTVRR